MARVVIGAKKLPSANPRGIVSSIVLIDGVY